VRRLQLARGLDDAQTLLFLVEALVDPSVPPPTAVARFVAHAPTLQLFCGDRRAAATLVACVEHLCGVTVPALLSRLPMILKALNDAEVLEDAVLCAWYDAPPESSWLVTKVRAKVFLHRRSRIRVGRSVATRCALCILFPRRWRSGRGNTRVPTSSGCAQSMRTRAATKLLAPTAAVARTTKRHKSF